MASALTAVCIDCHDPARLASFWSEVLGYPIETDDDDGDEVLVRAPAGRGPDILFCKVPEDKTVKNRLHLDVNPTDREQSEEVERVIALGATPADVGQGDEVSWVVLADPEGNEFCILRTRKEA